MNLSPDDPILTAYALGELPANEAAEVEQMVKNSPELQAAVAEIRQTAELLKTEFATESGPKLSETEKAAVVANATPADNVVSLPHRSFWRTAGLSAAAAAILCLLAWQFFVPNTRQYATAVRQDAAEVQASKAPREELSPADKPAHTESAPAFAMPDETEANADVPAGVKSQPEPAQTTDLAEAPTARLSTPPASPLSQPAPPSPASAQEQKALAKKSAPPAQDAIAPESEALSVAVEREATAPAQEMAAATVASPSTATSTFNKSEAYGFSGRVGGATKETILSRSAPQRSRAIATEGLNDTHLNYYAESAGQAERNFDSGWQERRTYPRDYHDGFARILPQPVRGDTARYPKYKENDFQRVSEQPLSTFSIDVDTASYANVRRFLNEGRMPPRDAVRIEEMINYFSYDYPQPRGDEPFSVNMEMASCPWEPQHRLLRVGLKGKEIAEKKRPASNFVFLIDVSGSMSPQERLPLIKEALRMLVKRMTENDRIAIVVYASSSGTVLESTSAVKKEKILEALDRLEAGGSTNGGQGIKRAYALAEENFIKGGVNRVILCTDGDFNVGITDQSELIELIQRKAKSGVFLSVLGVGTDNYKDALMQKLADKGNGNYHYLDSVEEAHKVLVQQMNGTLVTIAKDVKIQIEFNPAKVSSYRLIGYEKRMLEAEDFNNDKKDAGEIGAGHTVTALYEIVPAGMETAGAGGVDELKYQRKAPAKTAEAVAIRDSNEVLTLKLRYKKPDGEKSVLREHTLTDSKKKFTDASTDFRFAAAVASFGMILKKSEHVGEANLGTVLKLAREAKGDDEEGYRAEFINLVKKARELKDEHEEESE